MSHRTIAIPLLAAFLSLISASVDAATFMNAPTVHSTPGVSNTTTLATRPPCNYCGPKEPPPIPRYEGNDPFDHSANLNPGSGGGGGSKPPKKPNLY